jgi:hypothetical protein
VKAHIDIAWDVESVQHLRADMTDAQAAAFLERYERYMQQAISEASWQVLETLLNDDSRTTTHT